MVISRPSLEKQRIVIGKNGFVRNVEGSMGSEIARTSFIRAFPNDGIQLSDLSYVSAV